MTKKTAIRRSDGKIVGHLNSDGVFVKNVRKSVHRMRKYNGYGVDAEIIEELCNRGANSIAIVETDTNTIYQSSLDSFMRCGQKDDFGHGQQVFVPVWAFDRVY